MNGFLAMVARRDRAAGRREKRRSSQLERQFAHQRGLNFEPLETRTLLSASWDEPKGSTIFVDDTAAGLNSGTS
jgi:hypothetical protein